MKKLIPFLLVTFAACTHAPPHNYADAYAAVVMPEAKRHVLDESAVIVRRDLQMIVCIADSSHHTGCYAMIDWTPKPPPPASAPAPSSPPAPTVQPAAAPVADAKPTPQPEAKPPEKTDPAQKKSPAKEK